MAYTQQKTWSVGELVTAAMLNTYIRDNGKFYATPDIDVDTLNLGADPTFASTTFIDIDATNYKSTITIPQDYSRVALCLNVCWAHNTLGNLVLFNWYNSVTAANVVADDGIGSQSCVVANAKMMFSSRYILEGLTPGQTYTFIPRIRNTANTTTVFAGAGTANADVHTQCWAELC